MVDYQYDVFLSYKRNNLIAPWITASFYGLFKAWLEEKLIELKYPAPRIFFDQLDIEPGDPWPNHLKVAIQTSKVLVAVCSPSYFTSSWCRSEWESFIEREKLLGISEHQSLRIPVRHNDCEDFLSGIQYSDFYGHTYLARDYYQSIHAIEFERKVEDLAAVVAKRIHEAPQFQADWPSSIPNSTVQRSISLARL